MENIREIEINGQTIRVFGPELTRDGDVRKWVEVCPGQDLPEMERVALDRGWSPGASPIVSPIYQTTHPTLKWINTHGSAWEYCYIPLPTQKVHDHACVIRALRAGYVLLLQDEPHFHMPYDLGNISHYAKIPTDPKDDTPVEKWERVSVEDITKEFGSVK